MQDQVKDIVLDLLEDHPDNPRLFLREDVIAGITAQIEACGGYFDPAHALLVRPFNGSYQIVRGHHRKAAALRAGLEAVPCWVREMSDEEAYMQLVFGNTQGELSPLEIGMHTYKAVPLAEGGRGLRGGLAAYARQIGKSKQYIAEMRAAGEVLNAVKPSTQADGLLDKAKHFAAIHALPPALWPPRDRATPRARLDRRRHGEAGQEAARIRHPRPLAGHLSAAF